MELPRQQPVLTNLIPTYSVMLRRVSGLRGATLTFLPLLLTTASLSATLLMALVLDTSAQLTLWIASSLLFLVLSCVCYGWIYHCRQQTQIDIADTRSMLIVTTPFLGVWNFPMKRLLAFQAYTTETAPLRKRDFFTTHILGILALFVTPLFLGWYSALFVIPLILIVYPLLQNNKPSPFQSGIMLYFAKTENLHSLVQAPTFIHLCTDDSIIEYIVSVAEPIVKQNAESVTD